MSLLVSIGAGEDSYVMPDLLGREIAAVRRPSACRRRASASRDARRTSAS